MAQKSYRKYTNHKKPVAVNTTNIFNRSKAKPKFAKSQSPKKKSFRIQAMPKNMNKYKPKTNNVHVARDKSLTTADIQQKAGLAQLEHNWKTRKPYARRKKSRKLRQTEFKLLLDEHQMTECYDPVKLYEINKGLMSKTIGTCRVEGLKLIISVPNGRKDLTEGIQIIERIIGPVQYLDGDKHIARVRNANHYNTMHLHLKHDALQPLDANADDLLVYSSLPNRQRGTSMLSNQKGTNITSESNSTKLKLSEQFVIEKRKQTRRYSEDYVDHLKKHQVKSVLQNMMIKEDDDGFTYNSDDDDYKTAEYKTTTDVNMEQEWDDFDEIMTQDSLGIRLQAQLLMERKVKLREQQKAIRERLTQQQNEKEEYKAQESTSGHHSTSTMQTMIIHAPKSVNTRFNTDDIPSLPSYDAISSTMDELYVSYEDTNEILNQEARKSQPVKKRSNSAEVIKTLKDLSDDIEDELRHIDDKILNNNHKIVSPSSVSYNNQMLMMLKSDAKSKRNSSSTLPFHRSQTQNEALLRIIHTIQNMPKPFMMDYNQHHDDDEDRSLISLVTREFASAFRELSYGIITGEHMDDIDDDRRDSEETVPAPQSIDLLPPHSLMVDDDDDDCVQSTVYSIPKKRNVKYTLNKDINIDLDAYKDAQYIKSALFDDEDGLISNSKDTNHVMHSLLAQSDLLSEIIFYNIPSIMKHFALVLNIVNSLSFGLQHQRERILGTLLKKVSAVKNTDELQQRLLFLYWSLLEHNASMNHDDSDFYLYNEYQDLILYALASIIYTNGEKHKNDISNFIVESTKCWKHIMSHFVSKHSKIVLDCLQDLSSFRIPSNILLSSINMQHMIYNKNVSQFVLHYFVYQAIYQYKNCNVFDIFCYGYHGNNGSAIKLKSPFLLRIGIDCIPSHNMQYIYELMNCMWSSYKYILPNNRHKITIHNKILFLKCQSIAKNAGIWCLRSRLIHIQSVNKWDAFVQNMDIMRDIQSFAHHFIVSSATIFIASYIMALDWNEVLQTCFICPQYGDMYQLSPLSILLHANSKEGKSLNQCLNDRENVFLQYIYKWLNNMHSLQMKKDKQNINNLWNQWMSHVQRLFNIIVFNINQPSLNKDKKHYFDHSHLFQIIQITKMLYSKQIKVYRIIKHFSNLLNVELND